MGRFLFFVGVACVVLAAVTAIIGLDVNYNGQSSINANASVALGVAAIAAFKGSKLVAWSAPPKSSPE